VGSTIKGKKGDLIGSMLVDEYLVPFDVLL
jgi:hypothetical protein